MWNTSASELQPDTRQHTRRYTAHNTTGPLKKERGKNKSERGKITSKLAHTRGWQWGAEDINISISILKNNQKEVKCNHRKHPIPENQEIQIWKLKFLTFFFFFFATFKAHGTKIKLKLNPFKHREKKKLPKPHCVSYVQFPEGSSTDPSELWQ